MLSNPEIARGIEKWLRDNPHVSPERRRAAEHARLSCLVADRNDHQSDICRRLHRMNLARFVEALGAQ